MSEYSVYEAKARFSEILRQVRRRKPVFVTYRGKQIAKIVPVDADDHTLASRIYQLEELGLVSPVLPRKEWRPIVHRKDALKRFLQDRDRK